jgi:hypothetical protein
MQQINSTISLRAAILQLEIKQTEEGLQLKEQFHRAYESMKPINLIKSTLKEVTESKEIKDNLLNAAVGVTAGYLAKILFQGITHNPLKKLLGSALMFSVTRLVANNPETVKSVARGTANIIRNTFRPHAEKTKRIEISETLFI